VFGIFAKNLRGARFYVLMRFCGLNLRIGFWGYSYC